MKKILIIFMILFSALSIFSSSISFASESSKNNNEDKIQIIYFWGIGCHFCEKVEPFLQQIENKYKDDIYFNKYEIFKNKDNYKQFESIMGVYNIPNEEQGTPTLIINNKVLVGSTKIEDELEAEIQKALNNKNSHLNNDNKELLGLINNNNNNNNNNDNALAKKSITSDSMTLKAIFLAALVDSINPCAIMVLIILLSSLIVSKRKNQKAYLIFTTISFISAVFITYFVIGLGISNIFISAKASQLITIIVGTIAIMIGLANLKDAFFYRWGNWAIEIPLKWRNKLLSVIMQATSPVGAFVAGSLVTMFELPCTGGPYLFGLSLISTSNIFAERILALLFYNLIFISPLIIIATLVIFGSLKIDKAEDIKNKNVKAMHFITGFVMLLMGLWLVFIR